METPKPGDPLFQHTVNIIIGSNAVALQSAADKARALGYEVSVNSRLITGDAEEEAKRLVDVAFQYDGPKPFCLLQGGETTVRVTGHGKGGRNQHFALCALKEIQCRDNSINITVISGGTDGTDGPTNAAGAIADREVLLKAEALELHIDDYIKQNDAYHFFQQTNGLIITGPTQTNVMDIMMAIIH
jgi:glycerate 2-kinase